MERRSVTYVFSEREENGSRLFGGLLSDDDNMTAPKRTLPILHAV